VSRGSTVSRENVAREVLPLCPLKDAGHRDECHDGLLFPPEQRQIMREPDESQGNFFQFSLFQYPEPWIFLSLLVGMAEVNRLILNEF
jgi:hypothetical protein